MSADTITLTRWGNRWFAIDEASGLTTSGETRKHALDSLDAALTGREPNDWDAVSIVKTSDTLHGQPRIAGTRVGVFALGESVRRGEQAVGYLLEAYTDLTKDQVENALAYYDSHPNEMAALREEEEQTVRRTLEQGRAP